MLHHLPTEEGLDSVFHNAGELLDSWFEPWSKLAHGEEASEQLTLKRRGRRARRPLDARDAPAGGGLPRSSVISSAEE